MYKELNISETEGVWAAYLALCGLKEETERLQAACAAKEAELYELRSRTAELFGERLSAEGADEDAVQAAKAMWLSEPAAAAQAALGCDIAEAANPYGCNQYGHEWRMPHGGKSPSPKPQEPQRVPGGRAFVYRSGEKTNAPEKKVEKVPENKKETREAHKDNPNFKREVNNYIRRMKDIISREKAAYKEITSGKLSAEQTQKKIKEWSEAQNEYYQALQEFIDKDVQLDIAERDEISKLDIQSEEQIMQHFEDIEKRYPQAVK